ncbi:HD domain-containing protein [Vagococcus zengguangii]|uniref:HD domain-containing protein n=1 Tax=Vagococcus zengguangii TaxID=2571750 RepID=A0A4D7CYI4_9ENTE|nr:HD domain-containing protein [Vagococcus zengguangii]QCI86920.1 HD domain-containing protein [Vagococcus zengguangii]TLG81039.1 HD domain-containing protein [Vagococcus zengguangii]
MKLNGQVDLAGENYLRHLITVGNIVKEQQHEEAVIAVAYLHDILEDTKVDESQLIIKFSQEIVEAVKVLTKPKYESYQDYLARVKTNEWARIVKLAELSHNSELSRIKNRKIMQRDRQRFEKYRSAMFYLEKVEGEDKGV